MPGQQSTKRMGRPTLLTQVVRHRDLPDGTRVPVTAGEQVIERRRLGLPEAEAAASAGLSKTTVYHWRLDGARARAEEARGQRELTADEVQLRDFVNALERAEAEWEAGNLGIIARSAQGGHVVTKTTEKWAPTRNPDGTPGPPVMLERTVVTETLAPQWTAAAWQLERMRPDRYRRRTEVTGADGKPLVPEAEQARGIADALRAFQTQPKPARPARPRRTPTKGHTA